MASISGSVTGPTQGVYSATKSAVIMLSEALNEEVRPFNIQYSSHCDLSRWRKDRLFGPNLDEASVPNKLKTMMWFAKQCLVLTA
ncbi:SDR family NAD(P)-dependent oxidoreductase [Enterococcus cecorum]